VNAPRGATYPGWGPNTVIITAADFETGRLPGVCAVTGAPATANLERRYSGTPGWIGWLFFINWIALGIAFGALALVASIVVSAVESAALGIRGKVSKDGFGTRWVQLRGVHAAFVQAVASTRR
jgi:hypothetical protein